MILIFSQAAAFSFFVCSLSMTPQTPPAARPATESNFLIMRWLRANSGQRGKGPGFIQP